MWSNELNNIFFAFEQYTMLLNINCLKQIFEEIFFLIWFLRYKPKTAFYPYVLFLAMVVMFFDETENKTQTLFKIP